MEEKERRELEKKRNQGINVQNSSAHSGESQIDDFNTPLHRINVFNQMKKILLRMTRSNGEISLCLL
jgi:hypothetical protein